MILGVLLSVPIVLLLVVLTRTKKQSEYDEEARTRRVAEAVAKDRKERLEYERLIRLAEYRQSWDRVFTPPSK